MSSSSLSVEMKEISSIIFVFGVFVCVVFVFVFVEFVCCVCWVLPNNLHIVPALFTSVHVQKFYTPVSYTLILLQFRVVKRNCLVLHSTRNYSRHLYVTNRLIPRSLKECILEQ